MSFFTSMDVALSSLEASRQRLEASAMNLAHADSSAPAGGQVYQVRRVVLQEAAGEGGGSGQGVRSEVRQLDLPARLDYDPNHPDADDKGMVHYPQVDMMGEMSEMMGARRAYEAGLAVYAEAKAMFLKTLEIGK